MLLAAGIAAVVSLTGTGNKTFKKATIGRDAPHFELTDTEGRSWRLSDLKGKVVLLNFWASWCDTCRYEKPFMQNLADAERQNNKFVLLSVLYKDDPLNAQRFMREKGLSMPVLVDDKQVASQYGLTGVPETFIINKKGIIEEKVVGPLQWDSPQVRKAVTEIINR
jgi:DsbE subfamily thiol:disulfide oxidoreductase